MLKYKLKSSAILISLVFGVILVMILILVLAEAKGNFFSVNEFKQTELSHQAALSGIDDGLLFFQKNGRDLSKIYDDKKYSDKNYISVDKKQYYSYEIISDAVSYGEKFDSSSWLKNSDTAIEDGALRVKNGDTLKIDLNYLFKKRSISETLRSVDIKISEVFVENSDGSVNPSPDTRVVSSVSYELISNGKKISDGSKNSDQGILTVSNLEKCKTNNNCSLNINLSTGSKDKKSLEKKVFYLKIRSSNSAGVIKSSTDKPGTITIESTGYFENKKEVLQGKFDNSTGRFLGIYKNNVYCLEKCVVSNL